MHQGLALVEVGGVLFVLAVLGRIAHRLQFPTIPLFLAAGLILGDGGLDLVQAAREFIDVGAALGVTLLLFSLGLEFSPRELRSSMRSSAGLGVIDIVLNALPGVALGLLLGWDAIAVALMGAITYVSSSGIIAKLLTDLRRLGNRETPMVLSVLVLEDLVMAVFLPVIGVLVAGGTLPLAIGLGVLAGALLVGVLAVAPRFSPIMSRFVDTESSELLVLTIFGLVLLVAGGVEQAKISGAIGAFLLGIMLSGSVAERIRKLLAPLRDVFAALFFLSFGIGIHLGDFVDGLPVALALSAVGIVTKMVTGWWGARSQGVSRAGRLRAALALTPRGEFSILLAGLGVAGGVAADLQPVAAAYVFVVAGVGTLLCRFIGAPRTRTDRGTSAGVGAA